MGVKTEEEAAVICMYVSVTNTDKIFKIDITDPANPGEPQEWITIPGPKVY